MVTLQILVLPFLVRVRIPQHKRNAMSNMLGCVPFFCALFLQIILKGLSRFWLSRFLVGIAI